MYVEMVIHTYTVLYSCLTLVTVIVFFTGFVEVYLWSRTTFPGTNVQFAGHGNHILSVSFTSEAVSTSLISPFDVNI